MKTSFLVLYAYLGISIFVSEMFTFSSLLSLGSIQFSSSDRGETPNGFGNFVVGLSEHVPISSIMYIYIRNVVCTQCGVVAVDETKA